MGWPITIQGRYGKSKTVQTITFDSDRVGEPSISSRTYKGVKEYYIWIREEGRRITFASDTELASFNAQLNGEALKDTQASPSIPESLSKVTATYIDANEYAMLKAGENFTLDNVAKLPFLKQEAYMFELPRLGERFNAHGLQWKVEEFVKCNQTEVRIYARMVMGAL